MSKVLLVGSGLTSAITAYMMRPMYRNRHKIIVYERAKGMGGRMGTTRSSTRSDCFADLGMQYIAVNRHYSKIHKSFYEDLQTERLLKEVSIPEIIEGYKPREPGLKTYIAPQGMGAVVKYFFNKSDTTVKFRHEVTTIDLVNDDPERKLWKVSVKDGAAENFDTVLITIPVPDILRFGGKIQEILREFPEVKTHLENVTYTPRIALGIFFDESVTLNYPFIGAYVDDPNIHFIAIDNKKRGQMGAPTSIVVHSTRTFAMNHVNESLEKTERMMLQHLNRFVPNMPKPSNLKCIKWQNSQVIAPYRDHPGFVVLMDKPLLILSGDGFMESTFDGCISTGLRLAHRSRKIFTRTFKSDPRP